jgi:hypothetical protein
VAGAATTAAQNPAGSNSTVAPGNQANPGNQGQGRFNPPLSGTVEGYDATAKNLSVKGADGTSQKFDVTNARITKADKISLADLTQLVNSNEVVQVTGDIAADGSYNATQLMVLDPTTLGNGGNGFPGGRGQGAGGRTAPANGTPVAGIQPGAAGGQQPGFAGPRGGVILRNAALSGTKLVGTDMSGATVTVNVTSTTPIIKRSTGAVTDLTNGVAVSVTYRADQTGSNSALLITINE